MVQRKVALNVSFITGLWFVDSKMNASAEMDEGSDPWLIVASVMLMVQSVTMIVLLCTMCIMLKLYLISVPLIASITKHTETIGGLAESWSNPAALLSGDSAGPRSANAQLRHRTTLAANQAVEGCIIS